MARPKKHRKTWAGLAEEYGIGEDTLQNYEREGVDVNSPESVFAHRRNQQDATKNTRPMPAFTGDPEELRADLTYDSQRTYKLWQENRSLELRRQEELGRLVEATKVREDMMRIGSAMKAGLLRMEAELPPLLTGMEPGAMAKAIRKYGDELLLRFSDQTSELYNQTNE